MNWLLVLGFIILPYCTAFPNCCLNTTNYSNFLPSFSCNFTCTVKEEFDDACVLCQTRMFKFQNYSTESGSINFTKPVISCQELLHKKEKVLGRILLTWSLKNVTSPTVFLVEVRNSTLDEWNFVGTTNETMADVQDLEMESSYQFRVTPFVKPSFVLPPLISEWAFISATPISAPLNVTIINFRANKNLVEAALEWNSSKDNPCSYIVYWFPMTGDGLYGEKIISLPSDTLSTVIPELTFDTNYTIRVTAVDPSHIRQVSFVDISFVTPSCLTLTEGNFTICAPGPPQNLTVSWIPETKAILTWFPPRYASLENRISGYRIHVIEAANKHHMILKYKDRLTVEKDVLNVTISDLKRAIFYVFEIRAVSSAGTGQPAVAELTIEELSPRYEPLEYVPWHYIVPSVSLALIVILIAIFIHLCRVRKSSSKLKGCPSGTADVPDHLRPLLVRTKSIELQDIIGRGEFGVVHKGIFCRKKDQEVVAVKVLPAESVSRVKMLNEVEILQNVGRHRNVVGLIGFCLDVDKMYLVLEYCALGNLHSRLRKLKKELCEIKKQLLDSNHPLLESHKANRDEHHGRKLCSYIYQIALGMEHISSLRMVHRDLAARNILLCNEKQVKIADFGLSRDIYETQAYTSSSVQKRVPLRWMAPESIENCKFTIYSDVWSFGVLIWEIFKFGKLPYESLCNSDILPYLKDGYRLPKPQATSHLWYDLMLECWNSNPCRRPTFNELVKKTEDIINRLCSYTIVIDK